MATKHNNATLKAAGPFALFLPRPTLKNFQFCHQAAQPGAGRGPRGNMGQCHLVPLGGYSLLESGHLAMDELQGFF